MRTKALLGLAALAAGALTTMAQSNVYSLNIVGYVNVPVQANKFYMLGNPLDVGSGNIISNAIVLNDTFDGTLLYPWTATGYGSPEQYYAGFGWFPGTTPVPPGNGFFILPTTNSTITFVGQVTLSHTNALPPGFTLTSSAYPASLDLVTLGLTGQDGDIVYRFTPGVGYGQPIQYYLGYGWYDSGNPTGGPVNGPSLNVPEGIFYQNTHTTFQWTQSFTVN